MTVLSVSRDSQDAAFESPRIIGAAFGDPFAPMTFSGYARNLFMTLRKWGYLTAALSTRDLRWHDSIRGAWAPAARMRFWRMRHRHAWLWRAGTIERLSQRFHRKLSSYPNVQAVLQVGTSVYPIEDGVPFYCTTDATLELHRAAGRFGFGVEELSNRAMREANAVQRSIFSACHRIFAWSEWCRESIVNDYGQRPDKVEVVFPGACVHPNPPAPDKYRSGSILFVGRDWERKGGPLLIRAFELVRKRIPHATLTIIGCRPKIDLPGVRVLGFFSRAEPHERAMLDEAFASAHCFSLLSEHEPFGMVLAEAQLTATPVVALDRGCRREAVLDGETGLLVERATPEEVAGALLRILEDPEMARRMGQRGQEFAAGRFTWRSVADRICRTIVETLSIPAGQSAM